jgi:hypothetical protein
MRRVRFGIVICSLVLVAFFVWLQVQPGKDLFRAADQVYIQGPFTEHQLQEFLKNQAGKITEKNLPPKLCQEFLEWLQDADYCQHQ